jgi:hypothetical protein
MSDAPPLLGRHDAVPRRRWQWMLPALVVLALLGIVGSLVVRAHDKQQASPEHAINAYLDAVESGATAKAYGMLCAQFRDRVSQHEFQQTVDKERTASGGVVGHHVARVVKRGDHRVATYTVRRQDSDIVIDARLEREGGKWKPCNFLTRNKRVPAQLDFPPGVTDTGNSATTR